MVTQTLNVTADAPLVLPVDEVRRRLRIELQKVADDASMLRPEWEPLLDSIRVVGTVLVLEDLFPSCRIPPDKVVRKGGYNGVSEAIEDMLARIAAVVAECNRRKERK